MRSGYEKIQTQSACSTDHNFPDHTRPWQTTCPVETSRIMRLPYHDQLNCNPAWSYFWDGPCRITSAVETCRVTNSFVTVQEYNGKPLKYFMHWTTKNTVICYFHRSVETCRVYVTTCSIPKPTKNSRSKSVSSVETSRLSRMHAFMYKNITWLMC